MAFVAGEDLRKETITSSAKEIKCTTKIATQNDATHNHEVRQVLYHDMEVHESIFATESSAETSLHHFTMESDIDHTAELLPSGRIQSHLHGIKTAVSETAPPQLTSPVFNPGSSSLTYSQEEHFNQPSRTESAKKLVQPSLELPEGVLVTGKIEPRGNLTTDLYSDGIYEAQLETPDAIENVARYLNLRRKSIDDNEEDLYTDSSKHISFAHTPFLAQMNELSKEIQSKMELTDDIMFKNKVWNVPNPAEKNKKVAEIKLESNNGHQMGSTEKGDYKESGLLETNEDNEEKCMLKSTEHGGQTKGPLSQHENTSQKFLYVSPLHENSVTDDIERESFMQVLQDNKTKHDNHITVKSNACYADETQKMADLFCKDVNQCEGEAMNDKKQKDDVYLETVNNMNDQKLGIESNAHKLFDENSSMYPLSISNVVSSSLTFLSQEGTSDENTDNSPQSSFKTLSYDEESQPCTHLNMPPCAPQEDKTLSSKDTENQPKTCSNILVNNCKENHGDYKSTIGMKDCKAKNSVTNQPEFQRNRNLSAMCPEKVGTKQLTPILKELISSQSNEINGISTGSSTDNGGITIESVKKEYNNAGIKTLVDEHHAKHEPSEGHHSPYFQVIDQKEQIFSNSNNINKHYNRDDNNLKEVRKKPCHAHDKNSETGNQKESPEKEDAPGIVLQTRSDRDNNHTVISSSEIINNESLQFSNLQISDRSSDPTINSSKQTNKPACNLTNSMSCLTTCFSNPSYAFEPVSLSKRNSFDLSYELTISLDNSPNKFTSNISKSTNDCKISSLDPSNQCRNKDQESSFKSSITDTSDQFPTISHNATYQGTNNSSDFSESSDQSDNCRTTLSDSSYQDKLNSLHISDHCTSTSPDSSFKCCVTSPDPSDQCMTSCADIQCKNNSSDLSCHFPSTSPDPFNNCNTIAPDPSNQCTSPTLDSTYQWKNYSSDMSYSSDSSALCTMASLDPTDQCKTTIPQSYDKVKIYSLDTSDQGTTMIPDLALQCSVTSLHPPEQCTTFFADSTNQCKIDSIITSSDLSSQCPTIAPDSTDQFGSISGDPYDKCTTISSDLTYHWTKNSSNLSKKCAINDSASSKLESSYQYTATSLEPLGQCTTITSDPIYQLKNSSPYPSYQYTITSLDQSEQCTNTALTSSEKCRTISLDSSNYIRSDTNNHHSGSLTPSHHFIISSSDSSDLHTNDSSDPSCPTPLSLTSDLSDPCTTVSSDLTYKSKTTSSNHSTYEDIATFHGFSYQCLDNYSNGKYQFTNTSPNQHDQYLDNSINPSNQCTTCTTSSGHQCRITSDASCHCIAYSDPQSHIIFNYDTHNQCTTTSPNLPQQSPTFPTDLCTSTTNSDLPDKCTAIFGDPDLPCTTISLFPSCQHPTTSTSDQCTNISVNHELSLPYEIDCGPLKEPTQDEYGCIIKQQESSFLEEVRRIYLDNQYAGFSLLDSGIILTNRVYHLENIALMILCDGEELGTVIRSSKLFLYYQLEKHFYITQQLNEDWYYTEDRITKATMLMKKVPLTFNWLKTLHNFLCLPNDCNLLIPYAVVTDRNGSILFLMQDRDFLGVGIPPLGYMLNTMEILSKVLCFMRYCRIHKVLPKKITTSILYTPQGICFDPSSLCYNDDLCEFNKCLKECLLVFLFNGQQEESEETVELLLERAQRLLEEDWSPQICLARLLSTPTHGALPFSLPSFPNEN